jgi:biotin carboxyl carrier protein
MAKHVTTYFARNLLTKQTEATTLEVEAVGNGHYAVTLEGHRYELESLVLPHGAVSMLIDGTSYNVEFDEKNDEIDVFCRGQRSRFDVVDERRLRLRSVAGFGAEGKQLITSPMPGKIVKVFVKVGDEVQEGQGLAVVEAMKMENELKSPKAGRVTEVFAREGLAVENGARLMVVE